MFQYGRFDPREEEQEKKRKATRQAKRSKRHPSKNKTRKDDSASKQAAEPASTLRVIAEETEGGISTAQRLNTKINEEAFDDLGLGGEPDEILQNEEEELDVIGEDSVPRDPIVYEQEQDESTTNYDPTDEIQRALHISRLPIEKVAERWKLAPFLLRNLQRDGHKHFFPIQSLVIPDVIVADKLGGQRARDICVAAPTGSGKTLAFCLPVLNSLAAFHTRRLRALVVLPSRDLAQQVYDVFLRYAEGSKLKIGLAIGQTDFRAEQIALVLGDATSSNPSSRLSRHLMTILNPGNLELSVEAHMDQIDYGEPPSIPTGGVSAVDVLVCTPGRLVDHLDNTVAFSLSHLKFLIIDEADRLLSQTYHGWIPRVLNQTSFQRLQRDKVGLALAAEGMSHVWIDPVTWRQGDPQTEGSGVCRPVQLRKLLYSATLTKDPQKLAALQLVNPKFFNAHHLMQHGNRKPSSSLYSMPPQLVESTVECTAEQKPLVLLTLLLERLKVEKEEKSTIVVFTSSIESTHRLARLLQLLWKAADYGEIPVEFSSSLNQQQRSALMQRCVDEDDPVNVVVCSDGMSRGMDIPSVSVVINYDVPGFAKTYVHRCGRTARAGKSGEAISLLKGTGQSGQFHKLRQLIDEPERVTTAKVKTSLVREVVPLYKACVSQLQILIQEEERGKLLPTDMAIDEYVPT